MVLLLLLLRITFLLSWRSPWVIAVRLRFGKGLTLLRVGNSGTSNIGDAPRYMLDWKEKKLKTAAVGEQPGDTLVTWNGLYFLSLLFFFIFFKFLFSTSFW